MKTYNDIVAQDYRTVTWHLRRLGMIEQRFEFEWKTDPGICSNHQEFLL